MKIDNADMYEEPYTIEVRPHTQQLRLQVKEGSFTVTHWHDRQSLERFINHLRKAAEAAGL